MITNSANHVSFAVRDLKESLHFYKEVLGLESIPRPNFPFPGEWLDAGGVQIHLIVVAEDADLGTASPTLTPMANHTAFTIEDYARTLHALQSHGLEVFETSPEQGQMWVKDPDGNVIEFIVARRG